MARLHILRKMAREGFEEALASVGQNERRQFAFTEALMRFLEHWSEPPAEPAPAPSNKPRRRKPAPRRRARKPKATKRKNRSSKLPRWKRLGHKKPGAKPKVRIVDTSETAAA